MIENELIESLKERRAYLENELRDVVVELCTNELKIALNSLFEEYKVEPKPTLVNWSFYGEYDDEGGTDYYPEGITVYVDGEEVDMYKYDDGRLKDEVNEVICDMHDDLYEYDIEEVDL